MESIYANKEIYEAEQKLVKEFGDIFTVSVQSIDLEEESKKLWSQHYNFYAAPENMDSDSEALKMFNYYRDALLKCYYPVCFILNYDRNYNPRIKFSIELYLLKNLRFESLCWVPGFKDHNRPPLDIWMEDKGMKHTKEIWRYIFNMGMSFVNKQFENGWLSKG